MHYFIMKIPNIRGLQHATVNNQLYTDFKDFMNP